MSIVTGVSLFISLAEASEMAREPNWIALVNQWLADRRFGALAPVEDHVGRDEHPETRAHGASFTHFPAEAFAQFVLSLPWEFPEKVALIINPETGEARAYLAPWGARPGREFAIGKTD